jgi:hypothetical protein
MTQHQTQRAFASLTQQGAAGLVVGADPFFVSRREQLAASAARNRIPAEAPEPLPPQEPLTPT